VNDTAVFTKIEDRTPDKCSFCGRDPDPDRAYIANPDFTCTLCEDCINLTHDAVKHSKEPDDDVSTNRPTLN
jgi:hypothetical protein